METNENGRTLLETLAVVAVIGVLSVFSLQLFSKSMVQIRANDILNETYKLFSARGEKTARKDDAIKKEAETGTRVNKHQTFYVGSESQKRTSYGYGLEPPRETNCRKTGTSKKIVMVGAGKIKTGDTPIEKKVCRRLFQSLENEDSPLLAIYEYNTCNQLDITDCSHNITALDFEFKNQ